MTSPYQAMIDLAIRWLPFGGPPREEIMVTFGITPQTFYRRILEPREDVELPPELIAFALQRSRKAPTSHHPISSH